MVVETRSFNFRGFWGPKLVGATVDHRSANESVINTIVCQEEGLEDEIARRMSGERMQAGAASIIVVLVGGGDRIWSPPTTCYWGWATPAKFWARLYWRHPPKLRGVCGHGEDRNAE